MTRRALLASGGLAAAGLAWPQASGAQPSELSNEERGNMQVVADFVAAWNARDADRVVSFLADNARFTAGAIGEFGPLNPPAPIFRQFIPSTQSIKMTVVPGSTRARGPMVTHERIDEMKMPDGSTLGSGTWFAVFGLRDGKIVDFIDFQIA